ncbi:MAG: tetratricopeptide repeat protein [Candidatus Tritonobacter lacicola]|nr:tetratricopeptide repeat protein [Candidatus Tritonobacter lacicola]
MEKSITRLKLTIDTPEKKRLHEEISVRPTLISPYKKLAKLMIDDRDCEGAIKVLKLLAGLCPGDRSILEELGRAYVAAGKTRLAERFLKDMIKRWPESHAPCNILVKMYRDTGRTEKAIKFLEDIPAKSPFKALSHDKLHNIFFMMEDHERGADNLNKAIRRFGKTFRRCKDIGKLHSKCGRKKEAIKWYKEALKFETGDPDTFLDTIMLMGLAYLDMGDWKSAEEQYRDILKIKKDSYPGLINLAELKLMQGELDEAEALLKKIQKQDPSDSRSKVGLAELYLKRGEPAKAVKIGLLGLRQTPFYYANELLRASGILAAAYRDAGDRENGKLFSLMNRKIEKTGDPFSAVMSMADAYLKKGDKDTALKLLDILLSIYMGNSLIQVKMADVYFKGGDYAKAAAKCRKAVKEKELKYLKDRIAAHEILAKVHTKQNKPEKAKAERKKAKELRKEL